MSDKSESSPLQRVVGRLSENIVRAVRHFNDDPYYTMYYKDGLNTVVQHVVGTNTLEEIELSDVQVQSTNPSGNDI